jgi:aminoglycoside 6'-N-acetyltransferase I
MDTVIRRATKEDMEVWSGLRESLWPDYNSIQHATDLGHWLQQKSFRGWLVFSKEKPIGFAEAFLRPFANGCDSRPVIFLEGIWVREDFRRHGIALKLLAEVEKWALEMGIHEIGSDAFLDNLPSQQAHLRWGFEEMEKVVYFRKKI